MDKRKFKIGDKVKLKNPQLWSMGKSTGNIVDFDDYVRVDWKYEDGEEVWQNFPHLPIEIEHVVKVGEQLLFGFMGEIK